MARLPAARPLAWRSPSVAIPAFAAAALFVGSSCSADPTAPEGELPAAQIAALNDAFSEMGVWAAPGGVREEASIYLDCSIEGDVSITGTSATSADSTAYTFEISANQCLISGGGVAFAIDGSVSGEGYYTAADDALAGSYWARGTLDWSIGDRTGACIVSVDVETVHSLTDQASSSGSVQGTLCGYPVGNP